jgi:hypothetical protein
LQDERAGVEERSVVQTQLGGERKAVIHNRGWVPEERTF